MYYTIYKITNKINEKIYIGKHETKNLDDNYMGSGKHLLRAIKKYGIENFIKEILYILPTVEEMNSKEAEIVTPEFVLLENNYNICPGGQGGWGHVNSNGLSRLNQRSPEEESKRKSSLSKIRKQQMSENPNDSWVIRTIKGNKTCRKRYPEGTMKGKKHTNESLEKMKGHDRQSGEKNSQFGTSWVWHELYGNKKIKRELIDEYISNGWSKTYKPGYKPI